jgi:hypothetical protein
MPMQLSPSDFLIALFLHDVLCAKSAWGFSHRGELIVVYNETEVLLPLASNHELALGMQRRLWPECTITALSVDELVAHCLPPARRDGVLICAAVLEDSDLVTLPAAWLEKALRDLRGSVPRARP